MQVRVLAGFVDVRANFRSYVPGDIADIPKDKAEALAASGHVDVIDEAPRKSGRKPKPGPAETKVVTPSETK